MAEGKTGEEMCEYIVQSLKKTFPQFSIKPKEIWELSPTGELWPVMQLYEDAQAVERGLATWKPYMEKKLKATIGIGRKNEE